MNTKNYYSEELRKFYAELAEEILEEPEEESSPTELPLQAKVIIRLTSDYANNDITPVAFSGILAWTEDTTMKTITVDSFQPLVTSDNYVIQKMHDMFNEWIEAPVTTNAWNFWVLSGKEITEKLNDVKSKMQYAISLKQQNPVKSRDWQTYWSVMGRPIDNPQSYQYSQYTVQVQKSKNYVEPKIKRQKKTTPYNPYPYKDQLTDLRNYESE